MVGVFVGRDEVEEEVEEEVTEVDVGTMIKMT